MLVAENSKSISNDCIIQIEKCIQLTTVLCCAWILKTNETRLFYCIVFIHQMKVVKCQVTVAVRVMVRVRIRVRSYHNKYEWMHCYYFIAPSSSVLLASPSTKLPSLSCLMCSTTVGWAGIASLSLFIAGIILIMFSTPGLAFIQGNHQCIKAKNMNLPLE